MNYSMQQYMGFGITSFIPLLVLVTVTYYVNNLLTGLMFGFIAVPISILIGKAYISNPWTSWLEGKSLLALDFASPGKIRAYSVIIELPYLKMKFGRKWIVSLFNRSIASYLMLPRKIKARRNRDGVEMLVPKLDLSQEEKENLEFNKVNINKDDFAEKHFQLEGTGAPMLIFNSKTKSFLTKEMLNTMETTLMVEHLALLLAEQVKFLRETARQLSKNVVDLIMPNKFGELLANPYFRILMFIIVLGIMILLFAPQMPKFFGYVEQAGAALPGAPVTSILGGWL